MKIAEKLVNQHMPKGTNGQTYEAALAAVNEVLEWAALQCEAQQGTLTCPIKEPSPRISCHFADAMSIRAGKSK